MAGQKGQNINQSGNDRAISVLSSRGSTCFLIVDIKGFFWGGAVVFLGGELIFFVLLLVSSVTSKNFISLVFICYSENLEEKE